MDHSRPYKEKELTQAIQSQQVNATAAISVYKLKWLQLYQKWEKILKKIIHVTSV